MAANYVMVAAGQCGNQLCYELINQIDQHLQPQMYASAETKHRSPNGKTSAVITDQPTAPADDQQLLYDSFFRQSNAGQSSVAKSIARIVALDTEPKVIDDCITRRRQEASQQTAPTSSSSRRKGSSDQMSTRFYPPWKYDAKSVAFRHGGAGNNWSLGYSLAQGDFLEMILDAMRRQLEFVDTAPHLVFAHSLAGGTGSGLGTRVSECAADEFPDCLTTNFVVAPYHFGEVVVQHYNALLCLSKLQASSQSIVVLENETAQVLCQQMRGIARPQLSDLNCVLANHLTPLFLPKVREKSPYHTVYQSFSDDVLFLAAHPAYRFLNTKLTPQTSKQSVTYTFDHWPTLFKTIQRMQLSGAYSERSIATHIKSLGSQYSSNTHTSPHANGRSSLQSSLSTSTIMSSLQEDGNHQNHRQPIQRLNRIREDGANAYPDDHGLSHLREGGIVKSLASTITCHGDAAEAYLDQLQTDLLQSFSSSSSSSLSSNRNRRGFTTQPSDQTFTTPTKEPLRHTSSARNNNAHSSISSGSSVATTSSHAANTAAAAAAAADQGLFDEYLHSHHKAYTLSGEDLPVQVNHSRFLLHEYQRAAHVVANDQSMLPILVRARGKSDQMFRTGAYMHQYATYGVESDDFVQAFYDVGTVIQSYQQL